MVCTPPFSYVCPPSPHQGLADDWYQSMPVSITRVRGRDDDTCDHEASRSHRRGGHTARAAAAIVQHAAAALQPPYSLTGLASPLPRLVRPRAHAHTPLNVCTHTHTQTHAGVHCHLPRGQGVCQPPRRPAACSQQLHGQHGAWRVACNMGWCISTGWCVRAHHQVHEGAARVHACCGAPLLEWVSV